MTRGVDSGDKTLNPTFSVIPCTDCGFRIIELPSMQQRNFFGN